MGIEARQLGERAGLEQMSRSQGYADAVAKRSRNPSILPPNVSPLRRAAVLSVPDLRQAVTIPFRYRC